MKDIRVRTAIKKQKHDPVNQNVVIVDVAQDSAMEYNENVDFASWHVFTHSERGIRCCHSIHIQVDAQFPKGT